MKQVPFMIPERGSPPHHAAHHAEDFPAQVFCVQAPSGASLLGHRYRREMTRYGPDAGS